MKRPITRQTALALLAVPTNYHVETMTYSRPEIPTEDITRADAITYAFGVIGEDARTVATICEDDGKWSWSSNLDDDDSSEDRTCSGEHTQLCDTREEALEVFMGHHIVLISLCGQCGDISSLDGILGYIYEMNDAAYCDTCLESGQ